MSDSIPYYTIKEITRISELDNPKIYKTVMTGGINAAMEWRRQIQKSIHMHHKTLTMDIKMQLVHVAQMIERYCRPHIYKKHYINAAAKYTGVSEQKVKNIANGLTEKTIKKYSY